MRKDDVIVVYPIIIERTENETNNPYLVTIPDLNHGQTEGNSIINAIKMARDYIGTASLTGELPKSNSKLPDVDSGSIATLVDVNISEYRRKYDTRAVKKTITIPNYLNEIGKEQGINFSELMTKALKSKLGLDD